MLCKEFKNLPVYEGTIYRGIDTLQMDMNAKLNLYQSLKEGLEYTLDAYSSFTYDDSVSKEFGDIQLIVPQNKSARDISHADEGGYENEKEVLSYILKKEGVANLIKSLPFMIESVFGDAKIHLSVFRDYEEDWSNLMVDIESKYEIAEFIKLEEKLFQLIEKEPKFIAALEYVTISCV